jgi:aldehyde:ferredoxin oxidoreductase
VYNIREGWQPADDWLPHRLLSEPLPLASGRIATLTPDRLRGMIDDYYAARGLDAEGRPAPESLADLRLSQEADENPPQSRADPVYPH